MIAALLALAAAAAPLSCGAAERPGIATRGEDGVWRGDAVELCREIAQARRGAGAAIAFHSYRNTADLRTAAQDALAVLTPAERAIAFPRGSPRAGPPIAISRQLLLVRSDTPLREPSDLAGRRVCFLVASAAEAALNAWDRAAGIAIARAGFQEPVELRDAFDTGFCTAMAVDARDIPGGAKGTKALGAPLAKVKLFAVGL